MDTSVGPSYRGYRFPREIIGYCVWLYNLSINSLRSPPPWVRSGPKLSRIEQWLRSFRQKKCLRYGRGAGLGDRTSGIVAYTLEGTQSMKLPTIKAARVVALALKGFDAQSA